MGDPARRRQYLRELLERESLGTQAAVVEAMRRAGFQVTQATVSRDLRDLGVVRLRTPDGHYRYALPATHPPASLARLQRLLADTYVSLRRANNLVLLKLLPGNAHAAGSILDEMQPPGLLGTVAGDDTLLIVYDTPASAKKGMRLLAPVAEAERQQPDW